MSLLDRSRPQESKISSRAIPRAALAACAAIALAVTGCSSPNTPAGGGLVGQTAPKFSAEPVGGAGPKSLDEAKGKVVILNGPSVSSIQDRVKGCQSVLSKTKIEIISDNQNAKATREGGLTVMQSLLTRFPKVDGVFTVCDQEAIGADLAAKQFNRKDFMIVSVDATRTGPRK